MTTHAFIGGAGCGKTHQLIAALSTYLDKHPLDTGQKVLALTFMHGSRRRLNARLAQIATIRRSYECSTIDSFAWRIVNRWRPLASGLGFADLSIDEYDRICEAAGLLLEKEFVARWVSATFPCAILDEAQDLTDSRLKIIIALSTHIDFFVAADEFQCLDEDLRPNPASDWITGLDNVTDLSTPQRTKVKVLLSASDALRNGNAPTSKGAFLVNPGYRAALAGSWASNQIGWYGKNRSTAIITPATGQYSNEVIEWIKEKTTKKGNGPHNVIWEKSEHDIVAEYLAKITLPDAVSLEEVFNSVEAGDDPIVLNDVSRWLDKQQRCLGKTQFTKNELESIIRRSFALRRRRSNVKDVGVRAMTVHGAKNREFDNVIVLWPASVRGSDDQKRRLLYNAVTRAKERCLILVQTKKALESIPFT